MRVNVKAILADPIKRRDLMIACVIATQDGNLTAYEISRVQRFLKVIGDIR